MTNKILLTQGKFALVDNSDYDELMKYKWHTHGKPGRYYAYRSVSNGKNGFSVEMHQQILGFPHNLHCDHINHDGLDNRRGNLRLATNQQNQYNRIKTKNCVSRYKGVTFYTFPNLKKPWRATITINGKPIYLGLFKTQEEAALRYDTAAIKFFGEFARLNFPAPGGKNALD